MIPKYNKYCIVLCICMICICKHMCADLRRKKKKTWKMQMHSTGSSSITQYLEGISCAFSCETSGQLSSLWIKSLSDSNCINRLMIKKNKHGSTWLFCMLLNKQWKSYFSTMLEVISMNSPLPRAVVLVYCFHICKQF